MVEYKCIRCGYISTHRNSMKNHLNRKNICRPILDDTSIYSIKKMYGFEIMNKQHLNDIQIAPKQHINDTLCDFEMTPKQHLNDTQQHLNDTLIVSKVIKYNNKICIHCNKIFTRKTGLTKHLKICKEKKKTEQIVLYENNKITEMEEKITELEKQINQKNTSITNTNTNSNNHTNITNNIIINNLGEENIEYLRSKKFMELLNGIYGAIPKLIEDIHFNPEHPENQNIKYPNKKKPYLKIMKNNKWQYMDKKTELMDLIDSKCYMLKDKYYSILEKGKYKLSDIQRSRIDSFLSKYDNEDKRVILDLINRTELVLLTNG